MPLGQWSPIDLTEKRVRDMPNMMVQDGDSVDFTAGADIPAGRLVVFGARVFFSHMAIANGQTGSLRTRGVVEYAKATGEAWAVGARLWFDAGNNRLTTTSSTHVPAGYAAAAALSGAVEGRCLLGQ